MKALQIKKKHHYVWAYYLKGWSNDGVNVWSISKKGNSRCDSIRGIGCENNFYKVGALSKDDVKLINIWLKDCDPDLKKLHLNLVNLVYSIQQQALLQGSVARKKLNIDLNEIVSCNLFENYMSMQEGSVVDIIRDLREGDITCLSDKKTFWSFGHFMGHQFSRTKRMRDIMIFSLENSSGDEGVKNIWMDFYKRHWWFMCAFIGANLSKDISLNSKKKLLLVENKTSVPFITSDQPVININPDGHKGTEVDYYYPLSGERALLILNSNFFDFNEEVNDEAIIHFLNQKMAYVSGDTIFASDKDTLNTYRPYFNKRKYKFS